MRPMPPNAGKGRPKGVPNKATASIKNAFKEAFEELGGAGALAEWAKENQTEFYKLSSKLIPTEVAASVEGTMNITIATGVPRADD